MKIWILFILGTAFYFWQRYCRRAKKTVGFSFKKWVQENLQQFVAVLILDLAAMLILCDGATKINFAKWLPEGIQLPGELIIAFMIGAGFAKIWYEIFKKKIQ